MEMSKVSYIVFNLTGFAFVISKERHFISFREFTEK